MANLRELLQVSNIPSNMKKKTHVKNRSISRDLMIGLVSTVVIVSAIAVSLSYYFSYTNAVNQLQIKADEISTSLAQTLGVPLWNFDDETVNSIGSSYTQNEVVSHIEILNTQGNLVFSFHRKEADHQIKRSGKIYQDRNIAGSFFLILSTGYYTTFVSTFLWQSLLLISLILIALLCMIKLLMVYVFESRINHFSTMVSRFKDSNYSLPDNFVPAREFKLFFSVLHDMAKQIKAQLAQLRRSKSELETRVQERTTELAAINVALETEVTERKQSEELVREKERFQERLLNDMVTFVSVLDTSGNIIFVNNTPLKLSGVELTDVVGEKFIDAPWWTYSDEVRNIIIDDIDQCLSGETLAHDVQIQKSDGTLMWIEFSMHPIFDELGNVQYLIPEGRDISDRKEAEVERVKLEKQLQQAQKMEAIGTLAGGIAHDFNNMLAVIIGYAEIVRDKVVEDGALHTDLDKILLAGDRAKDLVEQILAFSRQSKPERIYIRPQIIVKEAIMLLRSSIPTSIEITQDIVDVEGTIKADPIQIHQIVMNLCTNAYQAMEKSGGTLHIGLGRVELSAKEIQHEPSLLPGYYVQLTVSDTGTGIDPAIQERIFDPFFTTKEVNKGTGMGLSTIHGIVKSHDGMISCKGIDGYETTFRVLFPETMRLSEEKIETESTLQGGVERILFVDDESLVVTMGKQLLEQFGYSVSAFTSSNEAFEVFKSDPEQFDLVITDQTMPGMTGADLAQKILDIRPNFPVIICTGHSSTFSKEKAMAMGVCGYVMKPMSKKDIAPLIRQVLEGKKHEENFDY